MAEASDAAQRSLAAEQLNPADTSLEATQTAAVLAEAEHAQKMADYDALHPDYPSLTKALDQSRIDDKVVYGKAIANLNKATDRQQRVAEQDK